MWIKLTHILDKSKMMNMKIKGFLSCHSNASIQRNTVSTCHQDISQSRAPYPMKSSPIVGKRKTIFKRKKFIVRFYPLSTEGIVIIREDTME